MSKNYLIVKNITEKNRFNCVLWARDKVPSLPFGLWTFQNKLAIVNTQQAKSGNVAIIKTGMPWGHVAVVKKVGRNHVTIQEANFQFGKITERHGTEQDLKIAGYFKPSK